MIVYLGVLVTSLCTYETLADIPVFCNGKGDRRADHDHSEPCLLAIRFQPILCGWMGEYVCAGPKVNNKIRNSFCSSRIFSLKWNI